MEYQLRTRTVKAVQFKGSDTNWEAFTLLVGSPDPNKFLWKDNQNEGGYIINGSLRMEFKIGQWVRKDTKGALTVMDDDVFNALYENVNS